MPTLTTMESGRRDSGWCHLALSLHAPDVAPFWSIKPSMLGMPRSLGIQSLPAAPRGTRKVGFNPGWVDENDLRVQYNPPHGRGGSHRGVQ